MRTFDFSPLYKSAIGFDRLAQILDAAHRAEQTQPAFPPYNIELTGENQYRISMAVAGFGQNEIEIEVEHGVLRVSGKKAADAENRQFLHRGIAGRDFERKFQLADYVQVSGANMANGLLNIELKREIPEFLKPRKIAITNSQDRAQPESNVLRVEKAEAA
ncbi:MAG: Hsp20 family protein [Cellvibrionaceae bacterium]|nr:Hsp20 family protein [Cellvibrionaceae bacterium]